MTTISADIVRFLQEEKNMTLKQIGGLMKVSEPFISRVASGQRNFTIKHLVLLEESLNFPFPLLIIMSRNEKSIFPKLQSAYTIGKASVALLAIKIIAKRTK